MSCSRRSPLRRKVGYLASSADRVLVAGACHGETPTTNIYVMSYDVYKDI